MKAVKYMSFTAKSGTKKGRNGMKKFFLVLFCLFFSAAMVFAGQTVPGLDSETEIIDYNDGDVEKLKKAKKEKIDKKAEPTPVATATPESGSTVGAGQVVEIIE